MQTYIIVRTIICTDSLSVAYKPAGTPADVPPYYLTAEPADINLYIRSKGLTATPIQALIHTDKKEAHRLLADYVAEVMRMTSERAAEVAPATRQPIGNAFMPALVTRAQAHAEFLRDHATTPGVL